METYRFFFTVQRVFHGYMFNVVWEMELVQYTYYSRRIFTCEQEQFRENTANARHGFPAVKTVGTGHCKLGIKRTGREMETGTAKNASHRRRPEGNYRLNGMKCRRRHQTVYFDPYAPLLWAAVCMELPFDWCYTSLFCAAKIRKVSECDFYNLPLR